MERRRPPCRALRGPLNAVKRVRTRRPHFRAAQSQNHAFFPVKNGSCLFFSSQSRQDIKSGRTFRTRERGSLKKSIGWVCLLMSDLLTDASTSLAALPVEERALSEPERRALHHENVKRVGDLFERSDTQLCAILGCEAERVRTVRRAASRRVAPSVTAKELLDVRHFRANRARTVLRDARRSARASRLFARTHERHTLFPLCVATSTGCGGRRVPVRGDKLRRARRAPRRRRATRRLELRRLFLSFSLSRDREAPSAWEFVFARGIASRARAGEDPAEDESLCRS